MILDLDLLAVRDRANVEAGSLILGDRGSFTSWPRRGF